MPFKEQELILAQEVARLAIWEWYIDRNQVRWLAGAVELFGRPLDEVRTYSQLYGLIDEQDRERFEEAVKHAVSGSGDFDVVCRVSSRKGKLHWIRTRGRLIHAEDGERLIIGVAQDISDSKAREQSLEAQARLLDLAREPVLVRDAADKITFWNKGAERLYGFSSDEAKGQVSHDLLRTRFPEPLQNMRSRFEAAGFWEGELIHFTKYGRMVHVASRWQKFTNGGISTLETNFDLSQQRALLVSKAWEEKAKLIGELSHEINNPLAAATTAAYMLRQECGSQMQEYVQILEASITRIAEFIRRSNELHQSARTFEEAVQRKVT